ncbi:MAG TPA: 50S ribosomal protein L18e [Euryarchaeota archaeon]|nr:50S ribosomal protein L18e [archaeon BMS3Abin16]GBE57083.1 50S ribosomal protein L18e [archaeon BMS3Bbin16]HDH28287.1 50S ribosomal protein L18e [Euryarchaeota archaeon]HDY74168.1 50S ribosomal protein L18e [Euryarchaeota archaeon]
MKRKSASTNDELINLIARLRKAGRDEGSPIWSDLAYRLSSSRKNRSEVNVSRINRYSKAGDIIVVAGKVLGSGVIGHGVTVAALSVSGSAKGKITSAGGKIIGFDELLDSNPKGKSIRVMEGA